MFAGITNQQDKRTTILYFCLVGMLGLSGAILGPSLPSLETQTGVSTEGIAWLFTAKALGIVVGALVLGRLYDKISGHRILAGATLCISPLLAAIPFINDLPLLLGITLLAGICEGGLHVGSNTLLVRLHGSRVAPYINGLHFSFGVGAVLAPAGIGISFDLGGGILWPYLGIALLMLVLPPFLLRLPTPKSTSTSHSSARTTPASRWLPVFFVLLFFLYVGAESGVSGWIYSYAITLNIADKTSAAWLTSLFWVGLTLGRLAGVPFSRRFPPRNILLVNLLGGIAAICWVGFAGDSFATLAIGTAIYGLMIASFFPTTMAFAGNQMSLTGSITGWFFVGAAAGGMTFPWLIGQFFGSYGPSSMIITAGGALMLGLVVYTGLIRTKKKL